MNEQNFRTELGEKLKILDRAGAEEICVKLIAEIYQTPESFNDAIIAKIMQDLRNKCMFNLMQQVGDAMILADSPGFKIRKLYAQALIDQNYLVAALSIINKLITDTRQSSDSDEEARIEWLEAKGLLGRIYKQLYVNTNTEFSAIEKFLRQSIEAYYEVYQTDNEFTWHGINVVALLLRAKRDKIDVQGYPLLDKIAGEILEIIKTRNKNRTANAWDFATAAEACIALGDAEAENALEWLSGYARMPYADAFELKSTLRQLEEVWQLDTSSGLGQVLLPILRAELLKRQGGAVEINANDVKQQSTIAATYKNLVVKTDSPDTALEKVFSEDSFQTYEWYNIGNDRCKAVARIGRQATMGSGTGFLMKGNGLHEKLGDELIILTNAHVISENPKDNALRINQAIIIFEILNSQEKFMPSEIIWSSPKDELDLTILRFDAENQIRLKELTKDVLIYPIVEELPKMNDDLPPERIFIIGHPRGGTLQLSLYDNVLLDYDDSRIHYRTPTAVGNSGSPVFNNQWELIGLHHSGSRLMPKLNGKQGNYEANEGIWIQAIKQALVSISL